MQIFSCPYSLNDYLHSIYIILVITGNLDMVSRIQEDVCRLYALYKGLEYLKILLSATGPGVNSLWSLIYSDVNIFDPILGLNH